LLVVGKVPSKAVGGYCRCTKSPGKPAWVVRPMRILGIVFGALLCFSIGVVGQSLVIWLATKMVRLICTLRQALLISVICNVLVFIPMIGILASVITFFVLLSKWLEAEAVDAGLVALVTLGLQFVIGFALR
jgi:hypothetical protein